MLQSSDIQAKLSSMGAIPVYQLSILDFLNQVNTAAQLAGLEPQLGPIEDDPSKNASRGYDLGLTVAQRILDRREEVGGRFTDLTQLAGIPYFGEDKLHDLIYTFTRLHPPIPTGLGNAFDAYIIALSELEIAAYRRGYSDKDTLSAVRKIFFDKFMPTNPEVTSRLNWNIVIPEAGEIKAPVDWGVTGSLIEAHRLIGNTDSLKIGTAWVNPQLLIAGLDAKQRPSDVVPVFQELKLESNLEFATFLLGTSNASFQYMRNFNIKPGSQFRIEQEGIANSFAKFVSAASIAAYADTYNFNYNSSRSLTWNLLSYYTDEEGPVKTRFQSFAEQLQLGGLRDGIFSNDSTEYRQQMVRKVENASYFELTQNGRTQLVRRMLEQPNEDGAALAYRVASGYVTDMFIDALYLRVSMEISKPAILAWNRMEARPRTKEFTRPLRAEVRDPLWFLCRQWQFGEFQAEDTGSCIEMRVDMETTKINRFSLRGGTAQAYEDHVPMETTVEREPVQRDLTIRQEMGIHFERLVHAKLAASPGALSATIRNNIKADFRNTISLQFELPLPAGDFPEVYSDPALLKTYACLGRGRALDGSALYDALKLGTTAASFISSTANATALNRVNDAAADFVTWFESIYNQPATAADSAWNPSQLEYQFQCSAPTSSSSTSVLSTTEYANGHLDWHSFDFETDSGEYDNSLTSGSPDTSLINRRLISVLPTDVTFPGMPQARWWQFEDYKVDIGDIKANTTEVPKLLMAEFALIYSNDWMLLPYDVAVGSLCDIGSIIVRDVFGQYTSVQAAGAGDNSDWQRWTMFNLHRRNFTNGAADTRLFVPPAVVRTMESEPIEKVSLLRDEMANMVWGVETSIPDGRGGHQDGWDASRRLYDYLLSITTAPPAAGPLATNDAAIQYQLGTTVPEHWIPFIPMRIGGASSRQIQLRRAAMPRIIPGRTAERIRPRTELLRTGYDALANTWGPYFLHEEEVPRSGVIVARKWQRTRWMDGAVHTWLGRSVKNGRGEANSGLEFDTVHEKET